MAFSRKSLYWLFGLAVAALVIGILIYFFRCDIFKNLGSCVEDPNETNTPVPPGSSTSTWVTETFPLNVGMYGSRIKALQTSLGITADGKFGNQTRAAIIAKGYTVPLSQADYDVIISNTTSGGIVGKSARSKSDLTAVYINDSATNPSFLKYVRQDQEVGIVQSADAIWYYLQGANTKVRKNEVYLLG